MIPLSLEQVARILGGRLADAGDGSVQVTAPPFIDTRHPEPGGLFVAVPGEHVDGHDFASAAVEAGAVAVLGARATGVPTVVVDDPVVALGRLGRHVLDQLDATVLALTGSQGKTGTKDFLAQLLAAEGATIATDRQPQQRDRRPTDRASRRTRHPLPRRRDGRARRRPHRRAVRGRPASRRGGAQRRHGAHRRVRLACGDRAGEGRDHRGAARRGHGRAERRRPVGRDDGGPYERPRPHLRCHRRRELAGRGARRPRPPDLRARVRRDVVARPAARGRRTPGAQRRGGGRDGLRRRARRGTTSWSASAGRGPCPRGGWRCTSEPTGWSW